MSSDDDDSKQPSTAPAPAPATPNPLPAHMQPAASGSRIEEEAGRERQRLADAGQPYDSGYPTVEEGVMPPKGTPHPRNAPQADKPPPQAAGKPDKADSAPAPKKQSASGR